MLTLLLPLVAAPAGRTAESVALKASELTFSSLPKPEKNAKKPLARGVRSRIDLSGQGAPVTDVITDPEGEIEYYDKDAAGTFLFQGELFMYKDTVPATILRSKDNVVYFKNIISAYPADYYVKGTVEGNTITVATDQTIEYFGAEGYGVNFGVFKTVPSVENGVDVVKFEYAPEVKSIEFKVGDDGSMEMILPGEPFDGVNPPEYVAGLYYTDNLMFTGFCDFSQKYTRLELQLISIPEGAEVLPYVYVDQYNYASIVDVAFYEGYLYIRGLTSMLPDATVKAKIDGNKAVIPQNEYMGIYFDMYYIFTKVLYENPDYDETDPESMPFVFAPSDVGFELEIDSDTRTISANKDGVYLSFHCDDTDFLNSLGFFGMFVLHYQASFAGTPSNPVDLEYTTQFAPAQGFNDFFFTLSNFSEKGTLLDAEYLYYKVFVNGKPLVFKEEETYNLLGERTVIYAGVPIQVELIPYYFNNNEDIFKFSDNAFDVGIYTDDVQTIGVQTVYYFENEFTYSDIVTLDVATGEITTAPGDNGVDSVVSDGTTSEEYFTLDGRRVVNPGHGIYLKVATDASGARHTKKVLIP